MGEFLLILAKGEIWSTQECSRKRGQVNWQEVEIIMSPGFRKAAESMLVCSFCGCIVMWVEEEDLQLFITIKHCHSHHVGKCLHKVTAENAFRLLFTTISSIQAST